MMEHGRDASQKAELRERIIMTATEAFTLKGIKCITMDDIAAALGISKRTLYEVFADKESLLKECILQKQAERDKYLQEIYEQSNNVLEVILAVFQKSIEIFHQTNKRFFEDIKKYPKVYAMMKDRSESDSEKTMSFFKSGGEDDDHTVGFFDDDIFGGPAAGKGGSKNGMFASPAANKVSTPCVGWLIALGGEHVGTAFRL